MADVDVKPEGQATPTPTVITTPTPDPNAKPAATPTDGKPTDGKPADAKPEDGKKPEGAPEKYETFKLPEGLTIDEEKLGRFSAMAKEFNLSQEAAQKMVDLAIENSTKDQEKQAQAWANTRKEWVETLKKDPEIGGAKLNESVQFAKRALKEFATPSFIKFLDEGWGDHPEMVRTFVNIGKKMSEDKLVDGKPSGTADTRSAAEVLYPTQTK